MFVFNDLFQNKSEGVQFPPTYLELNSVIAKYRVLTFAVQVPRHCELYKSINYAV